MNAVFVLSFLLSCSTTQLDSGDECALYLEALPDQRSVSISVENSDMRLPDEVVLTLNVYPDGEESIMTGSFSLQTEGAAETTFSLLPSWDEGGQIEAALAMGEPHFSVKVTAPESHCVASETLTHNFFDTLTPNRTHFDQLELLPDIFARDCGTDLEGCVLTVPLHLLIGQPGWDPSVKGESNNFIRIIDPLTGTVFWEYLIDSDEFAEVSNFRMGDAAYAEPNGRGVVFVMNNGQTFENSRTSILAIDVQTGAILTRYGTELPAYNRLVYLSTGECVFPERGTETLPDAHIGVDCHRFMTLIMDAVEGSANNEKAGSTVLIEIPANPQGDIIDTVGVKTIIPSAFYPMTTPYPNSISLNTVDGQMVFGITNANEVIEDNNQQLLSAGVLFTLNEDNTGIDTLTILTSSTSDLASSDLDTSVVDAQQVATIIIDAHQARDPFDFPHDISLQEMADENDQIRHVLLIYNHGGTIELGDPDTDSVMVHAWELEGWGSLQPTVQYVGHIEGGSQHETIIRTSHYGNFIHLGFRLIGFVSADSPGIEFVSVDLESNRIDWQGELTSPSFLVDEDSNSIVRWIHSIPTTAMPDGMLTIRPAPLIEVFATDE